MEATTIIKPVEEFKTQHAKRAEVDRLTVLMNKYEEESIKLCNTVQILKHQIKEISKGITPSDSVETNEPTYTDGVCFCGLPLLKKVTQKGPNVGKEYIVCSLPYGKQCKYWKWAK